MTAVPLGETPSLCILCPDARRKIARPGGMTDWDCHERLDSSLEEIIERLSRLTAIPGSGEGFGRRAPGYHSKPPLVIHNAALRDPRTSPAELGELHSPLNLLMSWSSWIRRTRGQQRATYPRSADDLEIALTEKTYLSNSMDWITRQIWVATFNEQVRAVVSQMRSATGDPNPRPVATCPCGEPLFPPRSSTTLRCRACDKQFDLLEQVRLAKADATACSTCSHASAQHDNDHEDRPCNFRWCSCKYFATNS